MVRRELRVYNFLNRMRIGIEADSHRLDKCEENIEETPLDSDEYDGLILVNQQGNTQVLRSENYPYLWKNSAGKRTEYYRYSTLVREIMRHSISNYELFEHTFDNEGVLDIFRKLYCQSNIADQDALVHASVLNVSGMGILIAGPCRSGKTSLTLGFLREVGGKLVSDGISIIGQEKGLVQGFYLPRQVYLRFSSIYEDSILHDLLIGYDLDESPQYFDHEALKRIIEACAFHVDAGITVSRKKIARMYNTHTLPKTTINRLILTQYSDKLEIRDISFDEALKRLRSNELPLRGTFDNIGAQNEIMVPIKSQIKDDWLDCVSCRVISFDSQKHINPNTLMEIVR